MSRNPHVVVCSECSFRVLRGSESDAEDVKENHDSGDCPGEATIREK